MCKTNILLVLIDDIIVEYPDTEEYIFKKLQKKRRRKGIPTDTVRVIFLASFKSKKHSYKPSIP